jgi:hypothetical protein
MIKKTNRVSAGLRASAWAIRPAYAMASIGGGMPGGGFPEGELDAETASTTAIILWSLVPKLFY